MLIRLGKCTRRLLAPWSVFVLAFLMTSITLIGDEAASNSATTSDQSSSTAKTSQSDSKAQGEAAKPGEQSSPNSEKQGEGANKSGDQQGKPAGPPGKQEGTPGKTGETAKPEEPKPVLRPSKPPKPPDPEELKVRPDADGKVRFNFNGQPWQPVLEWLAKISGMSLDWQELPSDYLNLSTQRRYAIREARDLINRHLLARGYTLLCQGEVLSVVNIKKLDPSLVPRVAPEDLAQRDPHEFVKVSFPLDWLMAETIIEELKPMISPNGKLTPLKSTNRLEAIDAVINLREIWTLLSDEQSTDNQQRLVREFVLQYARASEVYEQLQTLLGPEAMGEKKPVMPGVPNQPPQGGDQAQQEAMMRMQQQQQKQQQQQGGQPGGPGMPATKPHVTLVVNQRRNSILAHAPPDKMAIIAQAVEAIDVPLDGPRSLLTNVTRMRIYRLAGVDPEPIVKTLQEIGNLDPSTRLQVDKNNKAIIAYASLADHVTIRSVVEKLSGSERRFEVIRLRRLAADYVAGSITFMMVGEKKKETTRRPYYMWDSGSQSSVEQKIDEFRVEADVENNRLMLWANEVELAEVENLLVKLGEIPPKGRSRETVRVIDTRDRKEGEELLERIRDAWPSMFPNPLLLNPPTDPKKSPLKPLEEKLAPQEPATKSAGLRPAQNDALKFVQFSRAEASAEEPKEQLVQSPPSVQIKLNADGRIMISSEDPDALDALEDLAARFAPTRKDYKVFRLKYAWAYGVALNLEDFFKDNDKKDQRKTFWDYWYGDTGQDNSKDRPSRLSNRRPLKFIADTDSNTILVQNADAAQMKTASELIDLYDQPQSNDYQSTRKTETIQLEYSKAKVVADTIKDVYRDLLSANDKSLEGGKSGERDSTRTIIYDWTGGADGKGEQKMPKFKGQLSIGIDELSNSLIVSAPGYLFDQVEKMIKELDKAAAPTSTVKVLQLGQGLNSQKTREVLSDILGEGGSSSGKTQSKSSSDSQQQKQSKGNRNGSTNNSSSK